MKALIQMIPDGRYSNPDLERLANELREYVSWPEVMHTKEAAKFLGISESKLYRVDTIPSHKVPGLSQKVYLKSELIEYIKKH